MATYSYFLYHFSRLSFFFFLFFLLSPPFLNAHFLQSFFFFFLSLFYRFYSFRVVGSSSAISSVILSIRLSFAFFVFFLYIFYLSLSHPFWRRLDLFIVFCFSFLTCSLSLSAPPFIFLGFFFFRFYS